MTNLDSIRASALNRMERSERVIKGAILTAALLEGLLLAAALLLIDWHDPLQRLVLILSLLTYTVIGIGLVALGGHVSRSAARILVALEETSSH